MVHISTTTTTTAAAEKKTTNYVDNLDHNLDIPSSSIDSSILSDPLVNDKNNTMYGKVVKTLQKSLKKLIYCGANQNNTIHPQSHLNSANSIGINQKDLKKETAVVTLTSSSTTISISTKTAHSFQSSETSFVYSSSEEEEDEEEDEEYEFKDLISSKSSSSFLDSEDDSSFINASSLPSNEIVTSDSPISSINTSYDHESTAKRFQKLPILQGKFGSSPPYSSHATFTSTFVKPLLDIAHPSDSHKFCLLLDLDETLIHSSFTPVPNPDLLVPLNFNNEPVRNIYVCKRPGVDHFLKSLSEHFEIAIFTASLSNYADPVINFLDPTGIIKHRLYRESCVFIGGLYLKDLSRLGRQLDRCLLVDNCPSSYALQPSNGLGCRSWFSDMEDRELCDRILPILLNLAFSSSIREWREDHQELIDTPY